MAFTVKDWQDAPSTSTPISAAALEDMETRLATYTGRRVGYLSLEDEGCDMTGATDSGPAFAAAIATATAQGKQLAHLGGTLKLQTQIAGRVNFQLRGLDPELCIIAQADTTANHHMLDLGGYSTATTNTQPLTANAVKGSRTVAVTDASGYATGDVLLLSSGTLWPWSDKVDTTRGELVTVASKAGNTITTRDPLDDNYLTSATANTKKLLVTDGFLLEGVTLRNLTPATHTNGFLRLRGFRDPVIRDVVTEGADNFNFLLNTCDGFIADNIRMLDGNDNATAGRYVYGVAAYGATKNGRASNLFMRGGRHVFTTLGGDGVEGIPRHITVAHSQGTMMTNTCFDMHPEGELITFDDCHAYKTGAWGFALRSPNSKATGCTAYETVGAAFWLRADGQEVHDCTSRFARTGVIFSVSGDPGGTYDGQGIRIADGPIIQPDNCRVTGMLVEDSDADGMYIGGSSDNHTVDMLTVRRPGLGGSRNQGVFLSTTTVGHRFLKPRFYNCSNGFFGTSAATDVQIDGPEYNTVTTPVAGGMVPTHARDRDNGQRGILAPTLPGWSGGALGLTANLAVLSRFVPTRDMTVTLIAFGISTAATADDACDAGIYDAALTRIVSAGATLGKLNSTGVKTVPIAATTLKANRTYYAALSCGTLGGTGASMRGANFGAGEIPQLFGATAGLVEAYTKGSAHPLPTTITTPTITSQGPVLAVREA